MTTKKTATNNTTTSRKPKTPKRPLPSSLYDPPHPVWNSPVNAALGKLLARIEQTKDAIDEFVEEVGAFPEGMFSRYGDEFMTRLRALSLVMFDQCCLFEGERRLTTEENAVRWAAHKPKSNG